MADGIAYSIPIGDAIECLRVALYSNKQNVLDRAVVVARRITLDNSRIKEAHKDAPADEKSKSADSSHDGSSFLPHILPERVPVMISRRG